MNEFYRNNSEAAAAPMEDGFEGDETIRDPEILEEIFEVVRNTGATAIGGASVERDNFSEQSELASGSVHESLRNLMTPEGRKALLTQVMQRLESPDREELARRYNEVERLKSSFETAPEGPEQWRINRQINEAEQALFSDFGGEVEDYKQDLWQAKHLLDKDKGVWITRETGKRLLEDVFSKGVILEQAAENPELFLDEDRLKADYKDVESIEIEIDPELAVEVPIRAVVSATGFESWANGRNGTKDFKSSQKVIEDYASRETEVPPIKQAVLYVLPDGQYFLKSGNAHRVGAAKMKRQESMLLQGNVTVVPVEELPSELRAMY